MDTDSVDDDLMRPSLGRRHPFFQRSESTLCLGCPAPDPFNMPMNESLPLADQPHLLQPNARREELFGMPKRPITIPPNSSTPPDACMELPPVRLSLSSGARGQINLESAETYEESAEETRTGNTIDAEMTVQTEDQRSMSPKPGASGMVTEQSQSPKPPPPPPPAPTESYYKKSRPFLFKTKSYNEESEDEFSDRSEDRFSGVAEEPQDLSQSSSSQAKMDVDTDEREDLSESDSEDSRQVMKKSRVESPANLDEPATIQSTSTIRPPIIVTRRKVAAVIESVTANVLAKNKKTSLSECASATPETPLTLLPQNFYNLNNSEGQNASGDGQSSSAASGDQAYFTAAGTSSTSPGKSVIVRAGPSSAVSKKGVLHN